MDLQTTPGTNQPAPLTELKTDYLALRTFKSILGNAVSPQALADAALKDDLFIGTNALTQYHWILTYYGTHGTWPAEVAFEVAFEELPAAIEPLAHLANELYVRKTSYQLSQGLKEAALHLDAKRPGDAMAAIGAVLAKCNVKSKGVVSFKEQAIARTAHYAAVKAGGGPVTLPTPWPTLNKETQGLVDGSLSVVLAPANTGKSWMCCILANHVLALQHKILFITLEMSTSRMMTRLDSLRYKLPFGELRDVTLSPQLEASWSTAATADHTSLIGDVIVADKTEVRTVLDAYQLVGAHKPRVVIIDGGYRFEGSNKKVTGWESAKQIVSDLQYYAEISNIPWVVTSQYELSNAPLKVEKSGEHPMKMAGVKYAKEWVINPDVVVGMYQNDFDRATSKMTLVMLKARDHSGESSVNTVPINWDLSKGEFSEIAAAFTPIPVENDPTALLAGDGLDGLDFLS